jgi:hypothetical protein
MSFYEVSELKADVVQLVLTPSLATYDPDHDCVEFKADDYWIPASDLKHPKMQAHWFRHLAEKRWVTKQHLEDLAKVIEFQLFK